MQNTTLYSLFMPPEDCYGDFGLMCGFTATRQVLGQIRRTFTGEMARPVLAAFIHPTVNAISDVPGLAWMWMRLVGRGYNLLHAKVALLGFRKRGGDGYVIRLAVSTGNWTQDPLTRSMDLFWSIDLDSAVPDAQDIADIRAAHEMFGWLRERADCAMIERSFDGHRPDALLEAAITALPTSSARPRFIDSRNQALFSQVVERLGSKKKADRLILGSGYFESDGDGAAGLPERLRRALVQEKSLTKTAALDLFLNPSSCQGLAGRAGALIDAGWNLRPPRSVLHGTNGRLHAKFVVLASGETEASGRAYLGSGNLSMNGFERATSAGGNLEAGVIVDLPGGLKWPRRRDTRNGIAAVLPIQFFDVVTPEVLQPGEDFVRPNEPETQPPVAWLIWQDAVLSAPEGKSVMVIDVDGVQVQTPCLWPDPAPAVVTLAEGGWRLPVISSEALVVARPSDMSVEDILASLGSFPEPGDDDSEDEGEEGEEPLTDPSDTTEAPPAAYPIRRMMELLVRLCETQARLDPRDWQRWCRELQQNLCAIASREKTMLDFFRKARANPLPALADPRMRPGGVSPDLLRDTLLAVSVAWELSAYPSLWEREAA